MSETKDPPLMEDPEVDDGRLVHTHSLWPFFLSFVCVCLCVCVFVCCLCASMFLWINTLPRDSLVCFVAVTRCVFGP